MYKFCGICHQQFIIQNQKKLKFNKTAIKILQCIPKTALLQPLNFLSFNFSILPYLVVLLKEFN